MLSRVMGLAMPDPISVSRADYLKAIEKAEDDQTD